MIDFNWKLKNGYVMVICYGLENVTSEQYMGEISTWKINL